MLSKDSSLITSLNRLPWRRIGRWWAVGVSFCFVGLAALYFFVGLFRIPLLWATFFAAEITTIVRYGITDLWVFEERRPTWKRFWQFHFACAGGFVIWWVSVNVLPHFGIHYLLASLIGTAASAICSMTTNFLWVWRKKAATVLGSAIIDSSSEVVDAGL